MSELPGPAMPPLVTPAQARDVARHYQGLAEHLACLGSRGEAAGLERQSAWWVAYSIALAQTHDDGGSGNQ